VVAAADIFSVQRDGTDLARDNGLAAVYKAALGHLYFGLVLPNLVLSPAE
jgi:hypothetical protein